MHVKETRPNVLLRRHNLHGSHVIPWQRLQCRCGLARISLQPGQAAIKKHRMNKRNGMQMLDWRHRANWTQPPGKASGETSCGAADDHLSGSPGHVLDCFVYGDAWAAQRSACCISGGLYDAPNERVHVLLHRQAGRRGAAQRWHQTRPMLCAAVCHQSRRGSSTRSAGTQHGHSVHPRRII